MKKIILCLFLCGLSFIAKAQNASVENSTFGFQTGLLGAWIHNETKLSDLVSIRSEFGFDTGFWGGAAYEKTGYIFVPVLSLEFRRYHNLIERKNANKRIDGNTGNFISLKISHHPDWFVISNYKSAEVVPNITIVPTLGMRRNIGNHFTYELGFGVGYGYDFADDDFYGDKSSVALNILVRLGYRF